jgi:hypothetical protein
MVYVLVSNKDKSELVVGIYNQEEQAFAMMDSSDVVEGEVLSMIEWDTNTQETLVVYQRAYKDEHAELGIAG